MKTSKFKHKIIEVVKFHEIDMLGVCNNAVYFNYFEDARIKYMQDLATRYDFKEFLKRNSFVIMAHNEIDYINSAHLDDVLDVYSKVSKVSKSSFSFEHLIRRESDEKDIAIGGGVLVHINKISKISMELPEEFHKAILDFEGV